MTVNKNEKTPKEMFVLKKSCSPNGSFISNADKRLIKFADTEKRKKPQCSPSADGTVYVCITERTACFSHLLTRFLSQCDKKPFSVYTAGLHQVEDCAHTITIIGGHRVC